MDSAQIIRQVADKHGLSVDDLRGPCRKPIYVSARMEAAQRMQDERKLPRYIIARLLGRTSWSARYWLDDNFRQYKQVQSRKYLRRRR